MNARQLAAVGLPESVRKLAQTALRDANAAGGWSKTEARETLARLAADPEAFIDDDLLGPLARGVIADRDRPVVQRDEPAPFAVWGRDLIDERSLEQMQQAARLPHAVAGALMPDAHVGYGLPIGGVLALEHAVCPYAVGVDIACRMKLSILDMPSDALTSEAGRTKYEPLMTSALNKGSKFGVGVDYRPKDRATHAVMDEDWTVSPTTAQKKDKAWAQLGTSGSGNHFVEFGLLTVPTAVSLDCEERHGSGGFGQLAAGQYVALLSHSGSRGSGAAVCQEYSRRASEASFSERERAARRGQLGWLEMDTEAGQEYWAAMNLMGRYAAANHDVIHRRVTALLGAETIAGVENHHNFCWKETHTIDGREREVYVHRKGATPAGAGVLGVIPGSMGTPAHLVRGLGSAASLASASHGAGRLMSRKKAKETFRFGSQARELAAQGVRVLAAGADEVPGVYKDIGAVMAAQQDLVESLATFAPKVVRMCGDGSRAED